VKPNPVLLLGVCVEREFGLTRGKGGYIIDTCRSIDEHSWFVTGPRFGVVVWWRRDIDVYNLS
jgi:hypothetical protein